MISELRGSKGSFISYIIRFAAAFCIYRINILITVKLSVMSLTLIWLWCYVHVNIFYFLMNKFVGLWYVQFLLQILFTSLHLFFVIQYYLSVWISLLFKLKTWFFVIHTSCGCVNIAIRYICEMNDWPFFWVKWKIRLL